MDVNRAGPMTSADDLAWLDNALSVFLGISGRFSQYGALWQNDESKTIVVGWAATMDKYRDLINADVVHLRNPSGRSWDAMIQVDPRAPAGSPRGMAILWNPTRRSLNVTSPISVYYCGFAAGATVQALWKDGTSRALPVGASFTVPVARTLPPQSYDWVVLS